MKTFLLVQMYDPCSSLSNQTVDFQFTGAEECVCWENITPSCSSSFSWEFETLPVDRNNDVIRGFKVTEPVRQFESTRHLSWVQSFPSQIFLVHCLLFLSAFIPCKSLNVNLVKIKYFIPLLTRILISILPLNLSYI